MKNAGKYYCFNETGQCNLPNKKEVDELVEKGIKPIAFLDSNVCLNVLRVVDFGKQSKDCNRPKVLSLKEHISRSGLRINGLFGIMELCGKDGQFLNQKFKDFQYRLKFYETIPFKTFRKLNYNFSKDFYLQEELPDMPFVHSWYDNLPILKLTYCSLLKIRELALIGIKKSDAKPNIEAFAKYMKEDLGLMLGIEFKLALSIFGGRTEFRKMVGLDDTPEKAQKKVIGSTWDIFHSRFCTHNENISKHLGENISAFFVTNDYNLFSLLSKFSLTGIIDPGDGSGSTSFYNSEFDYPHFDNEFLKESIESTIDLMYDRRSLKFDFDREKIDAEVERLETVNNIK